MPTALDQSVKDHVLRLWFSGETRKNIAAGCEIGAGSVTNIISELKNGLEESDLEGIRELKPNTTFINQLCLLAT